MVNKDKGKEREERKIDGRRILKKDRKGKRSKEQNREKTRQCRVWGYVIKARKRKRGRGESAKRKQKIEEKKGKRVKDGGKGRKKSKIEKRRGRQCRAW